MVKESDALNLVEKYLNEKRLDCIEALYLWAKAVSPSFIAKTLRVRYGSGETYSIVINDLATMKIRSYTDITEDTEEEVGKLIIDVIRGKCLSTLVSRLREDIKNVSVNAKRVLSILVRAGWLAQRELSVERVWVGYRILYGVEPSELEKESVINELIRIGLIEYVNEYSGSMIFPEYVQMIADIDKLVKLPKIEVLE
jgi:hypothetical protein